MIFVAIEGPDGAGKSTLVERLTTRWNAAAFREPSRGAFGRVARSLLMEGKNEAALGFFCADRVENAKDITSFLKAGEVVISDRYYLSTMVYQLLPGASSDEWKAAIPTFLALTQPPLQPHATIILLPSWEVTRNRSCRDKQDDPALKKWVWERYKILSELPAYYAIDNSNQGIHRTMDQVIQYLLERFPHMHIRDVLSH